MSLERYRETIVAAQKTHTCFVVIGQALDKLYYQDKLLTSQKQFLDWTRSALGFSKSTTYEYIISYRVYSQIVAGIGEGSPPLFQSHCQLLARIPDDQVAQVWLSVSKAAPSTGVTTGFLEQWLRREGLVSPRAQRKKRRRNSTDHSPTPTARIRTAKKEKKQAKEPKEPVNESPQRQQQQGESDVVQGFTANAAADILEELMTPQKKRLVKREPDSRESADSAVQIELYPPQSTSHSHSRPAVHTPPGRETLSSLVNESDESMNMLQSQLSPSLNTLSSISSPLKPVAAQIHTWPCVPFSLDDIFDLGTQLLHHFDFVTHSGHEFYLMQQGSFYGKVFACLVDAVPFSTRPQQVPQHGGIERMLQCVYTRHANGDYSEGLFVIQAEFGADWFAPLLSSPHVIVRQQSASPYIVMYLGQHTSEFCRLFARVGCIPGVNSWFFS